MSVPEATATGVMINDADLVAPSLDIALPPAGTARGVRDSPKTCHQPEACQEVKGRVMKPKAAGPTLGHYGHFGP